MMSDRENAAFSFLTALCFLAFSPLDAPGGFVVACIGFSVFAFGAAILSIRNRPAQWDK